MPSPPFQIFTVSIRWFENADQSVTTWYRRAPTRPSGTVHTAIEYASSGSKPRRRNSRRAIQPARSTPAARSTPYQRTWMPSTLKRNGSPGLGIESAITTRERSSCERPARPPRLTEKLDESPIVRYHERTVAISRGRPLPPRSDARFRIKHRDPDADEFRMQSQIH